MSRSKDKKPIPIKKYIRDKLKMLRDEFCLKLTDAEIAHLYALKTENDVDNYAHQLLRDKL